MYLVTILLRKDGVNRNFKLGISNSENADKVKWDKSAGDYQSHTDWNEK